MDAADAREIASDGSRFAFLWPLLGLIFLPNMAAPLSELFRSHPAPLRLGLVLAGAALFVALYLWGTLSNDYSRVVYPPAWQQAARQWDWAPVAALTAVSLALILGDGSQWLVLLIFTGAVAGGRFSLSRSIQAVAAMTVLAAVMGWLTHGALSDIGSAAFWTGMAGVLTIIINHFRRTNRALHDAREENARLAVEAERLRFARDLHDLLGHDLARIALQSELAEALVTAAPEQAAAAMREVGGAARTALQEVRAAVAGYRQPTLASELRGAREILAAAGIAYEYEGERISAPPAVEAVLAWAVREGVTNVVKHSRARRCTICVTQEAGRVGVEIADDGAGAPGADPFAAAPGSGGNGLPGLAERAAALGGHSAAGPRPGGGFRLCVTLPVEQKAAQAGESAATQGDEIGAAPVERAVAVDAGGQP